MKAKTYISFTIMLGLLVTAGCLVFEWQAPNLAPYLTILFLAMFASTLKVRLPGIRATMSVNFLFILIGIAEFTLAETMTIGCMAALVQSIWKTKGARKLVRVLFNTSALAISIAFSYRVSHFAVSATGTQSLTVLLSLAACLYFAASTVLISGVLSLVESRPLKDVWQQCYLWSFPYYLVGAVIASVTASSRESAGWGHSLLILPTMYLVYTFYRLCLERVAQRPVRLSVRNAA